MRSCGRGTSRALSRLQNIPSAISLASVANRPEPRRNVSNLVAPGPASDRGTETEHMKSEVQTPARSGTQLACDFGSMRMVFALARHQIKWPFMRPCLWPANAVRRNCSHPFLAPPRDIGLDWSERRAWRAQPEFCRRSSTQR
jgi:hypothetical protein